jgi:hypothetical protein
LGVGHGSVGREALVRLDSEILEEVDVAGFDMFRKRALASQLCHPQLCLGVLSQLRLPQLCLVSALSKLHLPHLCLVGAFSQRYHPQLWRVGALFRSLPLLLCHPQLFYPLLCLVGASPLLSQLLLQCSSSRTASILGVEYEREKGVGRES